MDIDLLSNIFYAMVRCGTPLLLVALGELVCEKSGVLNLGQEGMMLFGAVIGFIVAFNTGNLWLGVLLAMFAGMLLSSLFALVALVFNANQVATGLALTIFGVGAVELCRSGVGWQAAGGLRAGGDSLFEPDTADRADAVCPGSAGVSVVRAVCAGGLGDSAKAASG